MTGPFTRLLLLYVMLGSALGGGLRYSIGALYHEHVGVSAMPWPTFGINLLGSLLIGFTLRHTAHAAPVHDDFRVFIATGVLGGFTTFSAFSYETVGLISTGDLRRAALYVAGSVGLSLLACYGGMLADRALFG